MNRPTTRGMTLIELTLVALIIAILSGIALGVYSAMAQRARFASTVANIRELDVACRRYQLDLNEFPPSYCDSSGLTSPTLGVRNVFGCGRMIQALMYSMSGNATSATTPLWFGPYISVPQEHLGDYATGGGPVHRGIPGLADTRRGDACFLDPWGTPYTYVRFGNGRGSNEYDLPGRADDATWIFNSPFGVALTSTTLTTAPFYNPGAFQIYSAGPNGLTSPAPYRGLDVDDRNNYNEE
jgi:prepilin-type N-terminal cleavage/methylation domain-containing protein